MNRLFVPLMTAALFCFALGCENDERADRDLSPSDAVRTEGRSADPRLNVILITVDTLRADALGAYGQKLFASPNLDRLAREGVIFLEAMTSAPSTLPSHASIMTAKHPYAHGARSNAGYILSQENETLAEVLQRAGYRTGAEIAANVIDHRTQLNQGFDRYRDPSAADITTKAVSTAAADGKAGISVVEERSASDITDFGVKFLERATDEPFFLWLHYFDPHAAYTAPPAFRRLLPDSPYHAEVRYVDSEIGRLIRNLERLGLRNRTLVVVTSDHGEGLGGHGEQTHAAYLFETTMRVPLILWGAESIPEDRRVSSLVRTIDIAPTILDLVGLPPLKGVQGRSLMPLVSGESADLQLQGYGESMEVHSMFGSSILRSIRRGHWKYIHKLRPELYDLARDPGELEDRSSRNPEKLAELLQALHQEIREAPAKPSNARVAVDDEFLRQLQALGYTGAVSAVDVSNEISTLELRGPDPSDVSHDLQEFSEGWYHMSIGQYAKSAEIFGDMARRHPASPKILTSQADALIRLERYAEAVAALRRVLEIDPQQRRAYNLLAESEKALGHFEEAEATYRAALDMAPCASVARIQLAALLKDQGRHEDQATVLEEGATLCPDAYDVLNDYAYLLSTSPNPELRDGVEAVRVAKLAVERSGGQEPAILDTLASAYAETGDFERAMEISRRAIDLAMERRMPIVAALKQNFELFRQGRVPREE